MRTLAKEPKATHPTTSAKTTMSGRGQFGHSHELNSIPHLHSTIGKQAGQRLLEANTKDDKRAPAGIDTGRFGYDFGHIPVHPRAEAKAIAAEHRGSVVDKSVDGESDSRFGLVEDKGPDAGTGPKDAGAPADA